MRWLPLLLMYTIPWPGAQAQMLKYPEEAGYGSRLEPPRVLCQSEDTYCQRVANYPERLIAARVNASAFRAFRQKEQVPTRIEGRRRPTEGDSEETRVCDVITDLVFPKAAKDKNGIWRYLVNDKNYRQPVQVEKCRKKNSPCSAISDHLGPGFQTRCGQTYISKLMMAFDENSLDTYSQDFTFPVACVCYVRNRFYPVSQR